MLITLWHAALEPYPVNVIIDAFFDYFNNSKSHFAPNPAELKEIIANKHKPKEISLPEEEAWEKVVKVMGSSAMHYEPSKAFNNLPKLIRLAVGNVSTLRQWSQTDIEKLSFAKREFISRYKEIVSAEDKKLLEPDNLLKLANGTYESEEVLEITGKTVSKPDPGQHMSSFLAELMELENFSVQKLRELEGALSD